MALSAAEITAAEFWNGHYRSSFTVLQLHRHHYNHHQCHRHHHQQQQQQQQQQFKPNVHGIVLSTSHTCTQHAYRVVQSKMSHRRNAISRQPIEIFLSKFQDLKGKDFQFRRTLKVSAVLLISFVYFKCMQINALTSVISLWISLWIFTEKFSPDFQIIYTVRHKKHQNFLSYLRQYLTDFDRNWYAVSWIN